MFNTIYNDEFMNIYIYVCMYIYIYVCMYIYICICMYVCIYIYTCTYSTYIPKQQLARIRHLWISAQPISPGLIQLKLASSNVLHRCDLDMLPSPFEYPVFSHEFHVLTCVHLISNIKTSLKQLVSNLDVLRLGPKN